MQLDATTPGIRARDLDRSGRRDLAATIRREGMMCSGLDLWIPPDHFTDPSQADRAIAAVLGAIDLAHDLATLANSSVVTSRISEPGIVSLVLPAKMPGDALAAISARAQTTGVLIADLAWPAREAVDEGSAIGVGIDPAVLLGRGDDPGAAVLRLGARVFVARLSDISPATGGVRVVPGARGGSLDLSAYLVSLVTNGFPRPVVVDLRGLPAQAHAVSEIISAVEHALPTWPTR